MRYPVLVLDTNVFNDRAFLHWLRRYPAPKVLPVVAYAELGAHFVRTHPIARLQALLQTSSIEIERMRSDEAERTIAMAQETEFRSNWRDLMITSHLTPNRFLVTNNVRDFQTWSLVLTPAATMERFRLGTS